MPKFKMPSFGVSAPGKTIEASLDVSAPRVEADVTLPSVQGDLKGTDLSIQPPSADVDVKAGQVGVKLPEGRLPEGELGAQAAGAGLKGHLPKVQMPSIKMPKVDLKGPQVDIKGPKLDVKGPKGEVTAPEVEVGLPSVDVDLQLEGDLSLGDKDVAAKDSKFMIPKFSIPSFSWSPGKASMSIREVEGRITFNEEALSLGEVDSAVTVPGGCPFHYNIGSDFGHSFGKDEEKTRPEKPHSNIRKGFFSSGKSRKDITDLEGGLGAPVPQSQEAVSVDLQPAEAQGQCGGDRGPAVLVPQVGLSGFASASLDLTGPHVASSIHTPGGGVTLTKYQVTVSRAPLGPEFSQESSSGSQTDVPLPSPESFIDLNALEDIPLSQTDSHPGKVDALIPASYHEVTFPKFYQSKFAFPVVKAAVPEGDLRAAGDAAALSSPILGWRGDSSGEDGQVSPLPSTELLPTGTPVSQGRKDQSGPLGMLATAPGEAPADNADREGKGSPFKMPRFKLPSFNWSPKKEVEPRWDPECSLEDSKLSVVLDVGQADTQPGVGVSDMEVPPDMPPEKDGVKGRLRKSGFAMPKLALPKMKASKGGVGLQQADVHPSLSSATAGGDVQATEQPSSGGGQGDTVATVDSPGEGFDVHPSQVCIPSLGFAKPDLRSSKAKVEVSQSKADLPLPKHDPSVGGGSQGMGLRDVPASQPRGEGTALATEDPPQTSCQIDAEVPTMDSPEEEAPVGAMTGDSHESWFKMPKFRMPSFRRSSSKESGGARGREVLELPPPASAATEEEAAGVKGVHVSGPKVEAGTSLWPPEAEADVTASEGQLHADILRHNMEGTGLKLSLPAAAMSEADLSPSEGSIRPAESSLPVQVSGTRLSETQAPAGEMAKMPPARPGGHEPAQVEERTEKRSSRPEGPLTLKASSTEVPSQISVVNVDRLWEDSVLTVKFPRLRTPRFSFPAASLEADVFVPTVREVRCPETSIDIALRKESPELWGASILKAGTGIPREQPVGLAGSPETSAVSKVRVHIQGAHVESQEVTIHSRLTPEFADLSAPEAFSTEIIRESEIPASEIQMPSYGFSLLKVKIPEPPRQARVCMVTQDSLMREGLEEAPAAAAPGMDSMSADLQPDSGEPFEIISSSVSAPEPQAFTFEVRPGRQLAGSCSDEEPAEILEFSAEDSQEPTPPQADRDKAPKEKPESKKSSGLFWSWLPNIGFSSSAGEASADSKADVPRSAPVQMQPEARPEAELPKKQEKAGWFRFPKLGFSSSPTKKSKSTEDEGDLAEQKLQEETVTFFDARESFSPEEEEEGEPGDAVGARPGSKAMVASTARTELMLLEQDKEAGDDPVSRPMTE
ncbi:PREDICTED: protein AHNAK2 [Galeopterus variegatus]|uniref:Protein AHNAK2 n=1 Tax=Galeopterus variegatus TaxID=482537 RepID=A0ABM0QVV5_GALVR|nr:PREDICTED: protein AHNAK2 [Galeopterus variegatus]